MPVCLDAAGDSTSFSVLDYGAAGDGQTDDSKAFLEAWNAMCSSRSTDIPIMVVPEGKTFLVKPVNFYGPCLAKNVNVQIMGSIIAPNTIKEWEGVDARWMAFNNVSGLSVSGSGTIDGRGSDWWNNSCRDHPGKVVLICARSSTRNSMEFQNCNECHLSNLRFVNSPQVHILVYQCNGIYIDGIVIRSPENSPNTDGIHIQAVDNMFIQRADIGAGDDCISIGDFTSNINVKDIICGPGHGISIGSLGMGGTSSKVENINVNNVTLTNTMNGVRIKTWEEGQGYCRGITFEHIRLTNVQNPIIIDQHYFCWVAGCKDLPTGTHISNVTFSDVMGTSSTPVAINMNCSSAVPCSEISLDSVQLVSATSGQKVTTNCKNVIGTATGPIQPIVPCLTNKGSLKSTCSTFRCAVTGFGFGKTP
uniref:Uncharacterized protein n=1 Tax=Nelumbo nucifera TaxID=4432 RepID=A0A822Y4F3_NELNU|nr:TPA_asm: hypothetical protein HUJ06_028620 [Nelumbo nucifera]